MGSKRQAWEATAERAAVLMGDEAEGVKHAMVTFFEMLDTTLGKGLAAFREKDTNQQWTSLLDTLEAIHSGETVPPNFKFEDEHYVAFLEMALRDADKEGNKIEAEKSISMLVDLAILYPQNIQPLLLSAGLIWREYGIQRALQMFESLMEYNDHPMIHFHGADCLWAAGKKERARTVLDHAIDLCSANLQQFTALREEIAAYKASLS